jgi:hypothetical protein
MPIQTIRHSYPQIKPISVPLYLYLFISRWRNYFSRLLNVHNVSDVRQIEVHTAEPLVPSLSRLEVEIAIAKLKKYK